MIGVSVKERVVTDLYVKYMLNTLHSPFDLVHTNHFCLAVYQVKYVCSSNVSNTKQLRTWITKVCTKGDHNFLQIV